MSVKSGEPQGEQITFELPSGNRTRSDLVTETPAANLKVRESKNGPSARLSPGQKEMKETTEKGGEVIPRGKKAEKAGLTPGKPTRIEEFEEDRY